MIYGYVRVSTKGQSMYGNGLEAQIEELNKHHCEVIFQDVYSGAKRDRPELQKLLDTLQSGDYLYVCKLDRIARSLKDGLEIIDTIVHKGCKLNILNIGEFSDTPAGRLTINIMLAISEFERKIIQERTLAGKEIAKENNPNYKEGRKQIPIDKDTFLHYKELVDNKKISMRKACRELGISTHKYYCEVERMTLC